MEVRKLQKVGNRSYSLCLPKTWIQAHGLKEKDSVFIEENSRNELLVKSSDTASRRPSHISVDVSKVEDIMEFMVFCYVRNVDVINLTTSKADYKKITKLKKTLKYLDGYDITAEDENKIVVSFLFKDVSINLNNIRRRMLYLLSQMLESIGKDEEGIIEEIETNIDKLYHLSKRIIFSCIGNAKAKEENGVQSDEDLFFLTLIFKKIENVADTVFMLSRSDVKPSEMKDIRNMIGVINGLFAGKESTTAVKALLREMLKKYSGGNENSGASIYEIADLCKDITENIISLRFDLEYFKHGNEE